MTPKCLLILLFALFATTAAQNVDELNIPDENDNQFPPDNHSESEGSAIDGRTDNQIGVTESETQLFKTTKADDAFSTVGGHDEHTGVPDVQNEPLATVADTIGTTNNENIDLNEETKKLEEGLLATTSVPESETESIAIQTKVPNVSQSSLLSEVTEKEVSDNGLDKLTTEPSQLMENTEPEFHTETQVTDAQENKLTITLSELNDVTNTESQVSTTEDLQKATGDIAYTTETYQTIQNLQSIANAVENIDVTVSQDINNRADGVAIEELQNVTENDEVLLETTETTINGAGINVAIQPLLGLSDSELQNNEIDSVPTEINKDKALDGLQPSNILATNVVNENTKEGAGSILLSGDVKAPEIETNDAAAATKGLLESTAVLLENAQTFNALEEVATENQDPVETSTVVFHDVTEVAEGNTEVTTKSSQTLLENVAANSLLQINPVLTPEEKRFCPEPCTCITEGDSIEYKVDCSGHGLTSLPKPLDAKTTELNLQNNHLTEIPSEISALKNLKTLNANNNDIMEIVSGSLSELPELTTLKLGNNRLIEYPHELMKFGLSKLHELDLSGNDMDLKPEIFSNFTSLRKLILPESQSVIAKDLCAKLKESLQTVCNGTCDANSIDCSKATEDVKGTLDFVLPGFISVSNSPADTSVAGEKISHVEPAKTEVSSSIPIETNLDAIKKVASLDRHTIQLAEVTSNKPLSTEKPVNVELSGLQDTFLNVAMPGLIALSTGSEDSKKAVQNQDTSPAPSVETNNVEVTTTVPASEYSLRSAVIKASVTDEKDKPVENNATATANLEVTVDAATEANKGGVDKSVIGIIVAAMVIVVAGITIKKNWSSIKNKFNSSPRAANDRVNANGTSPEEVPLQQKLPV